MLTIARSSKSDHTGVGGNRFSLRLVAMGVGKPEIMCPNSHLFSKGEIQVQCVCILTLV